MLFKTLCDFAVNSYNSFSSSEITPQLVNVKESAISKVRDVAMSQGFSLDKAVEVITHGMQNSSTAIESVCSLVTICGGGTIAFMGLRDLKNIHLCSGLFKFATGLTLMGAGAINFGAVWIKVYQDVTKQ